jgi:hypothetical protein
MRPPSSCEPASTRSRLARMPKGPYQDDVPTLIRFDQAELDSLKPKPITKASLKLLDKYLVWSAFWYTRELGCSIESAARPFLGKLNKSRLYDIADEMQKFGGPLGWFRSNYLTGIAKGKMYHGRDTLPSGDALAFFTALNGGHDRVARRLAGSGCGGSVHIDRACQFLDACETEIAHYTSYLLIYKRDERWMKSTQ